MTTLLDAPATTRKEKTMLRKTNAAATTTTEAAAAPVLPMAEQVSAVVVPADADPEQPVEAMTDTTVDTAPEQITEQSNADADADDEAPVLEPSTGALPTLPFVRVRKDMGEGDEAGSHTPAPAPASNYFFDDEDEDGVVRPASTRIWTDEGLEAFEAELDAKAAAAAIELAAEEEARKEQEAKAEAKRLSHIEKRGSRRMLGNILMWLGAAAMGYGAYITLVPGM